MTGIESYKGVPGEMFFYPNCKNIAPLFLGHVHSGTIEYRRITMEKPYDRVGEDGIQYAGPKVSDALAGSRKIGVFGPNADELVRSPEILHWLNASNASSKPLSLIAISSETSLGKASHDLVNAIYKDHVPALIALDRPSSHLAEQNAVKSFVPVVAISSDRALTSTNIPWMFRLLEGPPLEQALRSLLRRSSRLARTGPYPRVSSVGKNSGWDTV